MSRKRDGRPRPGPERRRYSILFTRTAERGLSAPPKAVQRRLDAKILALGDDPHPQGSIKLKGAEGVYRLRAGDYRVLYQVEDDRLVVVVVDVGNRRDVYRQP